MATAQAQFTITDLNDGRGVVYEDDWYKISNSDNETFDGENLIQYPYYQESHTENGITWTVGVDGTVTGNGTATQQTFFYLLSHASQTTLPAGEYKLYGCPSGGGTSNAYRIQAYLRASGSTTNSDAKNDTGNGQTFTVSSAHAGYFVGVRIIVDSGVTLDNLIFRPLLMSSSVATSGWGKTPLSPTADKKYLWFYEITTYSDGTTSTWGPVVIGTYGEKGDAGAQGIGYAAEARLFYLHTSSTTAPPDPTLPVTSTSTSAGVWTTKEPAWQSGKYYWTCHQFTKEDPSTTPPTTTYSRTTVIYDSALSTANAAAAQAQATANSKSQVFYESSDPPSGTGTYNTGDIWVKQVAVTAENKSGDETWYYDGSKWVKHAVGTTTIIDGSIVTDKIATNAIKAGHIDSGAVTTAKLDANAVTAGKIATGAVTADKLDVTDINASGSLSISAIKNDDQALILNSNAVSTANGYTDSQIQQSASSIISTVSANYEAKSDTEANNLIPYPYSQTTRTQNGITFTVNQDGSVTANGTASAATYFYVLNNDAGYNIPAGTYTASGCPTGGSSTTYRLQVAHYVGTTWTSYGNDNGDGVTFDVTDALRSDNIGLRIQIPKSSTVSNITFYPQIEYGSTKHAWRPTVSSVASLSSQIAQKPDNITLSVTNGSNGSTITLSGDNVTTQSGTIDMSGLVKFTDLSTSGSTIINGNNIKTGNIDVNRINLYDKLHVYSDNTQNASTGGYMGFMNGSEGFLDGTTVDTDGMAISDVDGENYLIVTGNDPSDTSQIVNGGVRMAAKRYYLDTNNTLQEATSNVYLSSGRFVVNGASAHFNGVTYLNDTVHTAGHITDKNQLYTTIRPWVIWDNASPTSAMQALTLPPSAPTNTWTQTDINTMSDNIKKFSFFFISIRYRSSGTPSAESNGALVYCPPNASVVVRPSVIGAYGSRISAAYRDFTIDRSAGTITWTTGHWEGADYASSTDNSYAIPLTLMAFNAQNYGVNT